VKTLGTSKNFLQIEAKHSGLANSAIAVVSAPYEHSVSYGSGTALGPKAILDASAYVEFYDDETRRELCFDVGIATLQPISFGKSVNASALKLIETKIDALLDMKKFVVTLGGEHTISAAPIASHLRTYPKMSVLQFDAHSDLRQEYQGSKFSHACVMARVAELMPPSNITQVGIRAQCIEEAQMIKQKKINTFYASGIRTGKYGKDWIDSVVKSLKKEVYITFDVDALDPAIMPSTGTPEPDGLWYHEAIEVVRRVRASGRRIVGLDVVELSPVKGVHHPDLTAARLVYKILNLAFSKGTK